MLLDEVDRDELDRVMDDVGVRLRDGELTEAWAEGQAMTLDQAIALAIQGVQES